jgi:acetyl-CoA C-acetyltransferase
MDDFAIQSLTRAKNAIEQGLLKAETAPVEVKTRRETVTVVDDEQPHKGRIDKIPSLRAAFAQDGTITAANASSISDGASALILASESAVEAHGLKPMAKIVAHARSSRLPAEFTLAPVDAISSLLDKTGWSADDVDLWEINEAFAMVTMLTVKEVGIDPAKVNIHGGACAQGHPIGSTGSRLIVTLMHALQQKGKKKGIASLCIGGGEATAVAIELV